MLKQLTGWHTITEIRDALDIPYEPIRRIVKHASRNEETWVKMAKLPRRWLIDTESEGFQRLLQECAFYIQKLDQTEVPELPDFPPDFPFLFESAPSAPCSPLSPSQSHTIEVQSTSYWPALRQWLRDEGVLIFSNILDDKGDWQWAWGELVGDGCENVDSAILMALQAKVAYAERSPGYSADEAEGSGACTPIAAEPTKSWFKRR